MRARCRWLRVKGGIASTFGELARPPVFRWYGLAAIATAFGGGFEAVAMREGVAATAHATTSPSRHQQQRRQRRWVQMLQLERRRGGGELVLTLWTWCAEKGEGHWKDA